MSTETKSDAKAGPFDRAPTGIPGLDEILSGGLPKGRVTLISGDTGSGKSMLALECLVNGAAAYEEPGLYVSFDTPVEHVREDLASLDWPVQALVDADMLRFKYFGVLNHQTLDVGKFTLDILLQRLDAMISEIGAKRVVLDTTEALFSVVNQTHVLRYELRRLFRWFNERKITLIVTVERPRGTSITGIEEFVSDCVVTLEQRMQQDTVTRRLHVSKYRGSVHGTNSYPYAITAKGNEVYPVTSIGLGYHASEVRQSLGIKGLDEMLGGGVYVGSSVLISGTAGSGKTAFVGHFAQETCRRGEHCLYLAYEESEEQICRNLRSIGLDLNQWRKQGLLHFRAQRPTSVTLERHLTEIMDMIAQTRPSLMIIDPISNFAWGTPEANVKAFLMQLVDVLKAHDVTVVFTSLIRGAGDGGETAEGVSSIIDTWISLDIVEQNDERNRVLKILKSRGSAHSNQLREFVLSAQGIHLQPVFLGAEGVVTGTQRLVYEARLRAEERAQRDEIARLKSELASQQSRYATGVQRLRAEHDIQAHELNQRIKILELTLDERRLGDERLSEQRSAVQFGESVDNDD